MSSLKNRVLTKVVIIVGIISGLLLAVLFNIDVIACIMAGMLASYYGFKDIINPIEPVKKKYRPRNIYIPKDL